MSSLTFHKLNELPQTFDSNSVYMVVKTDTTLFDLYVTSEDGLTIRQVASAGDSFSTFVIKSATQPQLPSSYAFWENTVTGDLYYQKTKDGLVSWDNLSEEPALTGTHDISITGNAATSTKLAASKNINGTPFDGSASITTAIWGTSRNVTVGKTAKAVNGSADVAWSLSEIGAASDTHNHDTQYEPKNANIQEHISTSGNPHGTAKADVGLGNVDNTSDLNKPVSTEQQAALDLKADLLSPALVGIPTAPTAAVNNNSTQLATTAFVNAEIANDAAPKSHVGSTGNAHGVATISVDGFMSATDKAKLDGIATGANNYTLPVSTATTLGGVKVSTGLSVDANGITTVSYGSAEGTAVQGNDARVTADQAAETASIRTLGAGALQAAPGNHTHPAQTTITGNAGSATKLETARNINGVAFDGTSDVTINAVDSTPRIAVSEKGVANGVATLDSNGLVQPSQLPSYVDDVLEFTNLASFPATGTQGKIYVALDTNKTYRWSGSSYIYITSGAVDSVAGKTGVVTLVKGDVGLGNVDNTSDLNKPVSTATQSALDLKANLESPNLIGTPTAPTPLSSDSSNKIATTEFVNSVVVGGAAPSSHVGSGGTAHAVVTTTVAGFMSATDKVKLDGIATGANNYTLTAATTTALGGVKSSTGVSIDANGNLTVNYGSTTGTSVQGNDARVTADQAAATASIRTLGTGAQQAAAGNHNHDTAYQPKDADLTAIAGLTGTSGLLKKTAADTWALDTTTYSTLALGSTVGSALAATASAGTSTTAAKSDHVHPYPTAANVGAEPTISSGTTGQVWRGDKTWVTLDLTYLPDAHVKKSVVAATTAALTVSVSGNVLTNTGTLAALSLDGVTLALNDRVLVKNQATASQNGIYYVSNVGSASVAWTLTRTTDADSASEIAGAVVNVDKGSINGGLRFDTDFKTTDTLNTTSMVWYQMIDTGMAATATPNAPGTANVGTSEKYAREDHVHAIQTTISGNAGTASKLETARNIALSGIVTGTASFDGSANISITTTATTATTSAAGIVQLSTATNSTSTTLAATPSAVKSAYDLATQALEEMIEPFLLMGV